MKEEKHKGKCRLGWEAYRKRLQENDIRGQRILNIIANHLGKTLKEKGFGVKRI